MISIRCSRLPLTFACAASTQPGLRVESADDEAARGGSALHQVMADWIQHGLAEDSIDLAAKRWRVERDDLASQCFWAWSAWMKVADFFPHPQCERPLSWADPESGIELTGHVDILTAPAYLPEGNEIRLIDMKSGRVDGDHTDQLAGYAWLALMTYPEADRCYVATLRTREQDIEGRYWTRTEAWQWYVGLVEHLQDRELYRPGVHCGHCPRGADCEAKQKLLQHAAAVLVGANNEWIVSENPERIHLLLDRIKLVEKVCESARALIKAAVIQAGGTINAGSHELRIEQQKRREIDLPKAWGMLLREAKIEDLLPLMSISKSGLEKYMRDHAPKGKKTAAAESLIHGLDQTGAIKTTFIERLEVRRSVPLLESEVAK